MGAFDELPDSVGGETPRDLGQPPHTYPRGRFCLEEGCDTRLSIYNQSDYCSLHEGDGKRDAHRDTEGEAESS